MSQWDVQKKKKKKQAHIESTTSQVIAHVFKCKRPRLNWGPLSWHYNLTRGVEHKANGTGGCLFIEANAIHHKPCKSRTHIGSSYSKWHSSSTSAGSRLNKLNDFEQIKILWTNSVFRLWWGSFEPICTLLDAFRERWGYRSCDWQNTPPPRKPISWSLNPLEI